MYRLFVANGHLQTDTRPINVTPPAIDSSSYDERKQFVQAQWQCLHNCELCGKCHMLHGKDAMDVYADYLAGNRSYMDITLELRRT